MSKPKSCEAVRVVVRCRPFNRREEMTDTNILEVNCKLGQITIRNPKKAPLEDLTVKSFTFDAVYDWDSKQSEIYDDTLRPLVESVLQGFNGTIFAYGQTGTGKTYTMEGVSVDPERRGIVPNSFSHIFTQISRSQNQQYLVRASYLEIYQEEIRDLLCKDNNKKLDLKENAECGVYVKDLSSVVTKNVNEIEHVMDMGNQSRSVGFTNMNERSSRSHTIFVVTVECSEKGADGQDHIRVGKLNMVDLAGSERQSKTGAKGARLKEAAKINLSLSALGNVISALVDGKSTHVPYRDSKLTRLLQDSLGGNAKTVMVATLGPASRNYEESLTTLRYANRAKNIKNKPRVNEDPKDALLREFQEEISRLKAQLEERGMLAKERRRRRRTSKRLSRCMSGVEEEEALEERDMEEWKAAEEERSAEHQMKRGSDGAKLGTLADGGPPGAAETLRPLGAREKMAEDMQKEQDAMEKIIEKFKSMESKLLVGGKNIIDHTNEQQKMLELKRQEIAEQIRREREIRQQVAAQDEETGELRETFTSLQQEVDLKTKKLKRLYAKLQLVKAEIGEVIDEHVTTRQELEQTQNELTRELKYKYLLIENFIPPEEKNKIMNRLSFDSEEDQWRFRPIFPSECKPAQVKKRPLSVVGYKRPTSQYAQMAAASRAPTRYQAENVMLLELDMTPPTMFTLNLNGAHLERAFSPRPARSLLANVPLRERSTACRVRKSRSWYQAPRVSCSSSSSSSSLNAGSQCLSQPPQRPGSASYPPTGGVIQSSP